MVNTEHLSLTILSIFDYNILNIVVNTERFFIKLKSSLYYNILNIVVNTEQFHADSMDNIIITY